MFKCPYCGVEGWLPSPSQTWLENYGRTKNHCLVATECCRKPLTVKMKTVFVTEKYTGEETEDDWGRTFDKS